MTQITQTLRQLASGFIRLRSEKKLIAAQHKKQLEPFNTDLKKLEAAMLSKMGEEGVRNYGLTEGGQVYVNTRSSYKIVDWEVFLQWMKDNDAWAFVTHKPAPDCCKEYLEETGHLPPGVTVSTEQILGVRAN